jgi:hypothetical protein
MSVAVIASTALALLAASSASAITIGETFDPSSGDLCSDNFTRLQPGAPEAQYEAPAAGVITSWSFEADSAPPDLKFKVGRPEGGGFFTIVAESGLVSPDANQLNTYPASIPVQAGDVIGSYTATTTAKCERPAPGYPIFVKSGEVLKGEKVLFVFDGDEQLDLSAKLEPYKCAGRKATIAGTAGNDKLVGTSGNDVIVGLEGKDKVKGLGGKDRICGADGKDRLKGGAGNDILKGAKGSDRFNGGGGKDKCVGGPGDDAAKQCEIERSI